MYLTCCREVGYCQTAYVPPVERPSRIGSPSALQPFREVHQLSLSAKQSLQFCQSWNFSPEKLYKERWSAHCVDARTISRSDSSVHGHSNGNSRSDRRGAGSSAVRPGIERQRL